MGLNERQLKAVMFIKEKGRITNKDYIKFIESISRITATRDLKDLVAKGILKAVGIGKRQVHYVINEAKKMQ
jgi:ATP-dependent DNA helicase RecG